MSQSGDLAAHLRSIAGAITAGTVTPEDIAALARDREALTAAVAHLDPASRLRFAAVAAVLDHVAGRLEELESTGLSATKTWGRQGIADAANLSPKTWGRQDITEAANLSPKTWGRQDIAEAAELSPKTWGRQGLADAAELAGKTWGRQGLADAANLAGKTWGRQGLADAANLAGKTWGRQGIADAANLAGKTWGRQGIAESALENPAVAPTLTKTPKKRNK